MYDFRTLSPLDFEALVRDLLQAEFGLLFESFGPGRDLGIDFRFSTESGNAIVQAKHYIDSGSNALLSTLHRENEKVAKLMPARYLLATSVSLSPSLKEKIQAAMPIAPLATYDIFGKEDLNNLLGKHPQIDKKHFKLWLSNTSVLERIFHSSIYNRTQTEMETIKKMVPKFVHNDSVHRAEDILKEYGALIISGEPGVGKSTLARMLVWLHAEQDWQISVIDDIKEAFEVITEGKKHLIFFDDFLGQVQLSTDLIRRTDQRLPPFLEKVRINKNLRFILTTRDYILHQAQAQSDRLSGTTVNASKYILNVGHYTRAARAQILFNHLYFSDISREKRGMLLADVFFLKIIDHKNFNPRLINILTSTDYASSTNTSIRTAVETVLENPQALWEKPYRSHFSDEGRTLMLALFFNTKQVPISILENFFTRMARAVGMNFTVANIATKFRSALKELEGSIFAIQDRKVSFSNPGIRDFLQRTIYEDRLLPAVIGVVTEFEEVNQAWEFYIQEYTFEHNSTNVVIWVQAANRLVKKHTGSPLQRLELLIKMYNVLNTENLLHPVIMVIRELEILGIDGDEADRCASILEQIITSLLPLKVLDNLRQVVTTAVATMLTDCGNCLNLDEIQSVTESLLKCGVDENIAIRASNAALEGHIDDLSDWLSNITSLDELQEYEEQLCSLINNWNRHDLKVASYLEDRREQLMERESRHDEEGYRNRYSAFTSQTANDEHIKSMFSNLIN